MTDARSAALDALQQLDLLAPAERAALDALLAPSSAFAAALALAESVHVHVKVDDTHQLPVNALFDAGARLDHQQDGFVKYRLPGGINAIFSHIAVSQDELREPAGLRRARPFLDHIGIDLRAETTAVRAAFDALPALGAGRGWTHAAQGGPGRAVQCCHVEVAAKHWLYPQHDAAHGSIPLEFAYGELKLTPGKSGCDLRPSDPRLGVDDTAACCPGSGAAAATTAVESGDGYYHPRDLPRFAQIGRATPELGDAFFRYYRQVMEPGLLGKREKALAALAVALAQKCPYCIDAYTETLHGLGVSEAEMSEIAHVAAAMLAGIAMVHSVQMMNKLDRLAGAAPACGA